MRVLARLGYGVGIGPDQANDHEPVGFLAVAVVPAGHDGAGRQSLEVPFPGAGMGLVKIVDVENQIAFRRSEDAEVE